MRVFVVIVTFNGQKWINKCLTSLQNSSMHVDVIVVDNNSTDDTINIVSKYRDATLIQLDENIGFGNANNCGIKRALKIGADFIFLLNQDAWIKNNTIEELVGVALQSDASFGIYSPIHLNGKGNKLDFRFENYLTPKSCKGFLSDLVLTNLKDVYQCTFINAAAWLVKKEVFQKVGGFDPLFFLYGEDTNYLSRLKSHGFKLALVPNTFIHHDREDRNGGLNLENEKLEARINFLIMFLDVYSEKYIVIKNIARYFLSLFFRIRFMVIMDSIVYIMVRFPKILKNRKCYSKYSAFLLE